MSDKLKPCPYCGSEAELVRGAASFGWYVACTDCIAAGAWDLGESGATERWNTRPREDALVAKVERLREECDDAIQRGDEWKKGHEIMLHRLLEAENTLRAYAHLQAVYDHIRMQYLKDKDLDGTP
jgi:Lar family restriction alleviation protein